jgi:hypothetical protein
MGYGMFWARGAMRSRGWGADGRVGAIGAMVVSRHRHSGTAGLPVKQHKWTVVHVCLCMWSGWCADAVSMRGAPLFFLTRWVDRCGGWRSSPGCICLSVHPLCSSESSSPNSMPTWMHHFLWLPLTVASVAHPTRILLCLAPQICLTGEPWRHGCIWSS